MSRTNKYYLEPRTKVSIIRIYMIAVHRIRVGYDMDICSAIINSKKDDNDINEALNYLDKNKPSYLKHQKIRKHPSFIKEKRDTIYWWEYTTEGKEQRENFLIILINQLKRTLSQARLRELYINKQL